MEPTLYLLDTNILLHLVRGGAGSTPIIEELEARFDLFSGRNFVYVSYVTVAEIRAIARRSGWGLDKTTALNDYLRRFPTFGIDAVGMLNAYVDIDNHSYYEGRDMGSKNDLWIAATARVHRMTLITTDKDFNHLRDTFISVAYIDPVKGTLTNDFGD